MELLGDPPSTESTDAQQQVDPAEGTFTQGELPLPPDDPYAADIYTR